MFPNRIPIACCLLLGLSMSALAEDTVTAEPQNLETSFHSPERVQIYPVVGGRDVDNHPAAISVLPGEQISFRADVLQAGNACPNPQGCRENRNQAEFYWSANDRPDDECSARRPETCRDRTSFQPLGEEMVFHIPYAMNHDITIRVNHENLYSSDTIVLHNAHQAGYIARQSPYPSNPQNNYDEGPIYPSFRAVRNRRAVLLGSLLSLRLLVGSVPVLLSLGRLGLGLGRSRLDCWIWFWFVPAWGWGWGGWGYRAGAGAAIITQESTASITRDGGTRAMGSPPWQARGSCARLSSHNDFRHPG